MCAVWLIISDDSYPLRELTLIQKFICSCKRSTGTHALGWPVGLTSQLLIMTALVGRSEECVGAVGGEVGLTGAPEAIHG